MSNERRGEADLTRESSDDLSYDAAWDQAYGALLERATLGYEALRTEAARPRAGRELAAMDADAAKKHGRQFLDALRTVGTLERTFGEDGTCTLTGTVSTRPLNLVLRLAPYGEGQRVNSSMIGAKTDFLPFVENAAIRVYAEATRLRTGKTPAAAFPMSRIGK